MMRTKNEPSSVETGRKTRSTKIEIDAFDEDVIRRTIHDMILREVALPTLKNLLETLSEKIGFTGKRETLRVILKNLGYTWKKCVDNRIFDGAFGHNSKSNSLFETNQKVQRRGENNSLY